MLRGHRLVAIVETGGVIYGRPIDGGPVAALAPIPYGYGKTSLTEIDVSDPSAMKVARELTFDGSFAAARQNGGTVRVVLNSTPLAYTQTGTVGLGARLAAAVALRLQRHRPQAHARRSCRATASAARRSSPAWGCCRSSR